MNRLSLTPHWNATDTRIMGALVVVMVIMTTIALVLRRFGRSEKGRALARDFGARTLGWWLLVATFGPAVLAGGWMVLAFFILISFQAWREFTGILQPGSGVGWRVLGVVVCFGLLGCSPALALGYGSAWMFYVLVVVQAGDVLQYICGKAFGRHALAPWLSPKKTWEGFIGGVAGTALLGGALAPLVQLGLGAGLAWGLGLALAGSASGLAMSAVKRRHGAKDFGAWLPGHGGILDRVDSLAGAGAFALLILNLGS